MKDATAKTGARSREKNPPEKNKNNQEEETVDIYTII